MPRREAIRSGSAAPSKSTLVERRATVWQSLAGKPFEYSGKAMLPRVRDVERSGMSKSIAKVRSVLARRPIERAYDSVLLNYYDGGKSGMNFHSDPGQGPDGGWGYSTCVVSCGATRLFTFRRMGAPHLRCTFALHSGDVMEMFRDCQALYQHAVKVES